MNEMNQSLELGLKPEKRTFAPLSVFYLVAVLGVMLGGWQQSFAEPVSGNTSASPLESRAVTANGTLSEREESSSNSEPGDHTLKKSPLTLPGIQSAILTVSKEIKTTAPIANLSAKPGSAKPAKASVKTSEKANPPLSTSDGAAVSKTSSGYYLDLPAPANRPEASADASGPLALSDTDSGLQPATTVPLSSVPSRLLEGNAQQSSSQADASSALDPEAQPLDLSSVPMLSGTATEALVRVTLGLLAVLGLLLGFSRGVLPRLMTWYPAFFDNLRRKGATTQSPLPPASLTDSANEFPADLYAELGGAAQSLSSAQAQLEGAPAASSFDFTSFDAPSFDFTQELKTKNAAPSRTWRLSLGQPKKQAVSPALEDASPFKVLFTSALGKDQALHLVEIGGRQMVLASTPYNISLIKDLGDAAPPQPANDFATCNLAPSENLASADFASTHMASDLAQGSDSEVELALLSLYPNAIQHPESPAEPVEAAWNPEIIPGLDLTETAQPETVEANSDESFLPVEFEFLNEWQETETEREAPAFMSPKSNAYATRPQRLIPLTEADRLYQQYLEILTPKTELEPEESVLPEPSLQSVVILNEYDDTYGY